MLVAGVAAAGCTRGSVGHDSGATAPQVPQVGSSAQGTGRSGQVIRGERLTSTIMIDPQITFAPPPGWAKPRLDGVQAWDESFLGGSRAHPRPIPADLSYRLGLLTAPPSVTDVLAWGYSNPPGPCPPPRLAVGATPPSGPRGRCIEWTFIDARNASNPLGTWQRLGTPSPLPTPTPSTVTALRTGGFVGTFVERFSPQQLVMQGPLSIIRWIFDGPSCSITLHWFLPPQTQHSPSRPRCTRHVFSVDVETGFASRGRIFSVIAGYVVRPNLRLVRAVLADGRSWIYDPTAGNGGWLFAVQRCGDYRGTAFRAVEELNRAGRVMRRLPIPAAPNIHRAASCR
jgi:hypothetical protein